MLTLHLFDHEYSNDYSKNCNCMEYNYIWKQLFSI